MSLNMKYCSFSQDVARVIYTLRVFALKSIAEKP